MVNENAIQCLIDRGYSKALIDENLQIPGSKFHDFFATDIKSLMLQCDTIKEITSLRQNGYLHVSYEFEVSAIENKEDKSILYGRTKNYHLAAYHAYYSGLGLPGIRFLLPSTWVYISIFGQVFANFAKPGPPLNVGDLFWQQHTMGCLQDAAPWHAR